MKTIFPLLVCLALSACGQGGPTKDVVTARAYTDAWGNPTPHADSLGFCFWGDGRGGKYETDGYNALINEMMVGDPDPDRIVRVIIHELENAQVLRFGGAYPDTVAGDWYLWSSENIPPFSAIVPEEGDWLASLPTIIVLVHENDRDWLDGPVQMAVDRLNAAAGKDVFVRP